MSDTSSFNWFLFQYVNEPSESAFGDIKALIFVRQGGLLNVFRYSGQRSPCIATVNASEGANPTPYFCRNFVDGGECY